jgi:SAM-dependent methyltransferase
MSSRAELGNPNEEESKRVSQMLNEAHLPPTFDHLPQFRATDKSWEVLDLGNYDGSPDGSMTAAQLYYRTAETEGALPLNQWIEWGGMRDAISQSLKGKKWSASVFEVGGGNGRQMREILDTYHPAQAVFIEKNKEMIWMAERNLQDSHVGYIYASGEEGLSLLQKNSFDLGVASLVLHYLTPEQLALFYIRLHDVLKPGGEFLFSGGTREFNKALFGDKFSPDIRNVTWYMFDTKNNPVFEMRANLYFREDHEALARMAGFDIDVSTMTTHIPPSIEEQSLDPGLRSLFQSPVWHLYRLRKAEK